MCEAVSPSRLGRELRKALGRELQQQGEAVG
jgi:hypothetical protein